MKEIDLDETDLRFLDPKVGIIGLKAKGKAKKDTSGFVRRVIDIKAVWAYNIHLT